MSYTQRIRALRKALPEATIVEYQHNKGAAKGPRPGPACDFCEYSCDVIIDGKPYCFDCAKEIVQMS